MKVQEFKILADENLHKIIFTSQVDFIGMFISVLDIFQGKSIFKHCKVSLIRLLTFLHALFSLQKTKTRVLEFG